MGTGPCGPPRGPPTTLVLGGRQKAVHPQLCPRGPPHGPHGPHGPRGPRGPPWLPLVPCVALERPPIILVRRPIYGPISCARLLPPVAPQICCAKIALDPSARFAECPAEKFFGGAMRGPIR